MTLHPLDFGQPTAPPRWLVEGVVKYGALTLLTGREGSAKSFAALALAASVARGVPWLGYRTEQARVLVIDQENPTVDALERLYGLGLRPDDQSRVHYLSQQGIVLVADSSAAEVEQEIRDFEPALVVIDGAVSAGGADPNDNLAVAQLLGRLRRWANRYDLAVLVLHHVPKAAHDDDPDAALGAGAWRQQVDAHIHAAKVKQSHHEASTLDDGGVRTVYHYALRTSSKIRWGPGSGQRQPFAVKSERGPDGSMRWLQVEAEGEVEHGTTRPAKLAAQDRIIEAVKTGGPFASRADLAIAVEMAPGGGGFKGVLAKAIKAGQVVEIDGRIACP